MKVDRATTYHPAIVVVRYFEDCGGCKGYLLQSLTNISEEKRPPRINCVFADVCEIDFLCGE